MAGGSSRTPAGREQTSVALAEELLDKLFTGLNGLVAGDRASSVFPDGVGSIDMEIGVNGDTDAGLRVVLRISSPSSTPATHLLQATRAAETGETQVQFNKEGHHVIAMIAMLDMKANSPGTWDKVQKILNDGDRTLKEAATFPDDIRSQQPKTKPFHFIDIPFEDNGPVNPPLPDPPHVLSKLKEFSDSLKAGGGSAQEKVDALSWLIHLFGDVHQPLHCIEHSSELHPGGDRGGNSFQLRGKFKNLHSLWDSSVDVSSPKDEDEIANDVVLEHPRASLAEDLQVTDTERWARSSFALARTFAYSLQENPSNPPKPPSGYIDKMEEIGRRQAALAGYRLADRLKAILG